MSAALSVCNGLAAPVQAAIHLPLSGLDVSLSPLTGLEDLLLVEDFGSTLEVTLQLMQRLVRTRDGEVLDLPVLPLCDLDVLVLRLRQLLLGDRIETDASCQAEGCGARMDISFGIESYLEHHRPLPAPWQSRHWLAVASEPGWFRLTRRSDGRELGLFRLPTARDLLETQHDRGAVAQLGQRCIRPTELRAKERHFVESAMETIAPSLAADLHGTCPACGAAIRVAYEPRSYCIAELRQGARFVVEEVDLLAERYHWSEREILAMPNRRRVAYAELARQSHGGQ
jgi:hypothetical protein